MNESPHTCENYFSTGNESVTKMFKNVPYKFGSWVMKVTAKTVLSTGNHDTLFVIPGQA